MTLASRTLYKAPEQINKAKQTQAKEETKSSSSSYKPPSISESGGEAPKPIDYKGYRQDITKQWLKGLGYADKQAYTKAMYNRTNDLIKGKNILDAKEFQAQWNLGLSELDKQYESNRESLANLMGKRGLVGSPAEADMYRQLEEAYMDDKQQLMWRLQTMQADYLRQGIYTGLQAGLNMRGQNAGMLQAYTGQVSGLIGNAMNAYNTMAMNTALQGTWGQNAMQQALIYGPWSDKYQLEKQKLDMQEKYYQAQLDKQNDSGGFLGNIFGTAASFGIGKLFGAF